MRRAVSLLAGWVCVLIGGNRLGHALVRPAPPTHARRPGGDRTSGDGFRQPSEPWILGSGGRL